MLFSLALLQRGLDQWTAKSSVKMERTWCGEYGWRIELRFHIMIKHGMTCPRAALTPSLVLFNHFFIMSSICFSVILCNQWSFEKYTSKQPQKYILKKFGLWDTLLIWRQNRTRIATSVLYVQMYDWKKHLFDHSVFFPCYFNFFPSMPLSLRDLRLSSHLPGQLKCKVTLQLVFKSITSSHSFTVHVVLQMRRAEERYFQLYSLTLELDRRGAEKQMFGAHSYT